MLAVVRDSDYYSICCSNLGIRRKRGRNYRMLIDRRQ